MSLLLGCVGTVLFWAGVVGLVTCAYRLFVSRDRADGAKARLGLFAVLCLLASVVGYAVIFVGTGA